MIRKAFNRAGAAVALAVTSAAFIASVQAAASVEEAQALISSGDLSGALKKLDAYLVSSPQDAEARFTRGLVLVKLNRTQEAIKAFSDLTRDYPQLPEPYNNLAVLYAQQGDYEKARDALEAALATHPSYATAHENLGDIYAALAGAAYNRALMLDQGNQGVRYKLSLINQLGNGPGAGTPSTSSVPIGTPKATTYSAPPPAATASIPPPAPVAAAEAPPPVAATPTPTSSADKSAVAAAIGGWAGAWSSKDPDGYLAYYAPDFQPPNGQSRSDWEAQRRERLSKPSKISVRVLNPQVSMIDSAHARVTFTQDYRSDDFSDQVTKVVELHDADGSWKIVRESIR